MRGVIEYEKDHASFVPAGRRHGRSGSRYDERYERMRRRFRFHGSFRQYGSFQ